MHTPMMALAVMVSRSRSRRKGSSPWSSSRPTRDQRPHWSKQHFVEVMLVKYRIGVLGLVEEEAR
jgi:hypothetical protein